MLIKPPYHSEHGKWYHGKNGESVKAVAMTDMQIITAVTNDLGEFKVRRTLPAKARTMVGPFIFVDQFGPASFDIGNGMDVRPHPHINLSARSD